MKGKKIINVLKGDLSMYSGGYQKGDKRKMTEEEKYEWKKFRESGLLWFINSILHLFGYAIVVEYEQGQLISVMPKRVCFRGFEESANTEGYERVTKYLNKEIKSLLGDLEK